MKKRTYTYLLSVVACLCTVMALLAGCSDDPTWNGTEDTSDNEGKIAMNVLLPGAYAQATPSRVTDHDVLKDRDTLIHTLPEGSTLRLFLSDKAPNEDGSYPSDATVKQYTYVVRVKQHNYDGNKGSHTLNPCDLKADAEGKLILDADGLPQVDKEYLDPYYLPQGNVFYFMAVSPAYLPKEVTTDGKKSYKYKVKNREELLTTNNHWKQTQFTTHTVEKDSLYANITLNPLMHNTARIRFFVTNEIKAGEKTDDGTPVYANVTSLSSTADFAELDRIPTEPGGKWTEYTWNSTTQSMVSTTVLMDEYNLALGDSIVRQMGNNINHNQLIIPYDQCKQTVEENKLYVGVSDENDKEAYLDKVTLEAQTHILPVDIRPTPMYIRLRLMVNETPMTFQYSTMKYFRAGYTYDYTVRIRISSGKIYIATWQDHSWSYDLGYDPEPSNVSSAPVETIGEIIKISNDHEEE